MRSSFLRKLEIIVWSGLTNVVMLAAFVVGWNFQDVRSYAIERWPGLAVLVAEQANSSPQVGSDDKPGAFQQARSAMQQAVRGDMQLTSMYPQREFKEPLRPLSGTVLEKSSDEVFYGEENTVTKEAAAEVAAEIATAEPAVDVVGPEGAQAQSISPVLRLNKSGKLEIGNFDTVSLQGDSSQCLEMGYTLLGDANATQTELKVLAQNDMITMAQICASNGSVIITCRSDQVTISPRRLKPNESCTS